MREIKVSIDFASKRIDHFLQANFPEFSRVKLQSFIKSALVFVNGEKIRPSFTLSEGDVVSVAEFSVDPVVDAVAEEFDLELLYEDKACLVVNKPAGVVVHPAEDMQHSSGTVVHKVLNLLDPSFRKGLRPGIVHRLDQDTSGIMVIAKNKNSYKDLVDQFKNRTVEKNYITLVGGNINPSSGVIDSPIGRDLKSRKKMAVVSDSRGKTAVTEYHLDKELYLADKDCSLLNIVLKTGRTHQIRVHLTAIGFPVIGDSVYGSRGYNRAFRDIFGLKRQFLHAARLKFISPATKKPVDLKVDLPADLKFIVET